MLTGSAPAQCQAVVILPARDEEATLHSALDALGAQAALDGKPLDPCSFEIILLLNNCSDRSSTVATRWRQQNPAVHLHVVERTLPEEHAFVGHARRLLMDTAWARLAALHGVRGILSTDADTLVAPDWIARNLAALHAGADAVGGMIELRPGALDALPAAVRRAYLRDRRYQHLVAQLEDRLDPQPGDPWPRHLQHFGASLACTPRVYALAGGLPDVHPLEDVAFVARLWRAGARLRHDPAVKVYTSARLQGRAGVGLSGQLTLWQQMSARGEPHRVQSSAWLAHRFRSLAVLRRRAALRAVPAADYLAQIDSDRLIRDSFTGERESEIRQVNRQLTAMLRSDSTPAQPLSQAAPAAPADNPHAVAGR